MKQICYVALIILGFLIICHSSGYCQTPASVQEKIEKANKQFIKWFNSGQADSVVTQYHVNACITNKGCGREFILKYYQGETGMYTVRELITEQVTLADKIATETGQWKISLANGAELTGKYKTEWQQVNNRWVILKETNLN
jgi:hypothetical protein